MAALQPSLVAFQSSFGKVARIIDLEGSWFDGNMVPSTRTGRVLCLPSLADEGFDLGGVFAVVCLATTVGCPLLRWLKVVCASLVPLFSVLSSAGGSECSWRR